MYMRRPKMLDLFCGAGGAAMGYHRAGFDVVGVDLKPQPRYPFPFVLADALQPPFRLGDFDAIHASPPCQAHTALRRMWNAQAHEDLIPKTRALLRSCGRPYVIENVPGSTLGHSVRLCGSAFRLQSATGAELRRHRYFETSAMMLAPGCHHGFTVLGVYGGHIRDRCRTITITGHTPQQNVERNRVRLTFSTDDARQAMGIDWMSLSELSQAIPPAYTEFIGRQLLQAIQQEGVA
jgi:DNA (cytosine-5)-methyltransferase 1